jgi:hypothetical protein
MPNLTYFWSRWNFPAVGYAHVAVFIFTALVHSAIGAQLTLNWDDNSPDELGFKIERNENGAGFVLLTTVGPDVTTYVDTTVVAGTNYVYRVAAYNSIGNSPYTNDATNAPSITTQPTAQTATAYQNATFTVSATGIPAPSYQWRKNGTSLVDGGGVSGATTATLTLTAVTVADMANYSVVASNGIAPVATSVEVGLTVNKRSQNITFNQPADATYSPGGQFPLVAVTSSGLLVSFTSSDSGAVAVSGSIGTTIGAGTTTITASQAGDANTLPASPVSRTISVQKAFQTVTFPPFSTVTVGVAPITLNAVATSGLPITYLSFDSSVASISGNVLTVNNTGATNIRASQPGDANYFQATYIEQRITVDRGNQTITFPALAGRTFGDPSFSLPATTTSGLPITYQSSNPSVATVNGSTAVITGAGSTVFTASQPGNFNYFPATPVSQSLTVGKATLTVSGDALSRTYGAANPTLTATFTGFVNGQTLATSGVTGAPSFSTTATVSSGVGGYPVAVSVGTLSSSNYQFSFSPGNLAVTKAPLNVAVDTVSRVYGAANPAFSAVISGFANGENLGTSGVNGAPVLSTSASLSSPVGNHTIAIAVGSLSAANYSFTLVPGTMTITKAPLTVTADPASRAYGAVDATFGATLSGFVNGESLASSGVTGVPAFSTNATATSPVGGAYAITPNVGSLSAANYSFNFVSGAYSITKAPLSVVANSASRSYGSANPSFSATFSGFANGESLATSGVSGTPALTTNATSASAVGSYPISAALGSLAANNYSFNFTDGVLTVSKAPLVVTANPASRIFGAADPAFSANLTGFVNGENLASSGVTGSPTFASSANLNSPVGGAYTITPALGSLVANNYSFTFAPGALTVTKAPLTVTADPASRAYGAVDPAFSATFSGFVNGENLASSGVLGAPAFSTSATLGSPVGTYTITPALGALTAANYSFNFVPGNLTVSKATLTVSANAASRIYGAADPVFSATFSGFVNGENLASSGVTGSPLFSTNATAASPVSGSYAITPVQGTLAAGNYSFSFVPGALSITKAPLTVTADPASRAFGAADPVFTATLSGFVNGESPATAAVTGNAAFASTATAASPVGTYPITPAAGTLAAPNYSFVTMVPGTLTISQAAQTIDFAALANRFVGEAPFALSSTASSGLPVSFASSNPAVATVSGSTVTVVAAGTTNLTASQVGNSNYLAATDVVRALTILASTPAVITSHPSSQSVISGTSVAFSVTATGGPSPSIKWQLSTNGGSNWSDLTAVAPYSGVTTSTLTITGVSVALTGAQYRAVATNASGSVNSNAATLTVSAPVTPPPIVTPPPSSTSAPFFLTHPVGQVVQSGASVTLSASLTGTPTPTLQWRKNGAAIAGANGPTLTLTAVTQLDSGVYTLFASNSAGSVLSNSATVTVQSAPVFVTQPSSNTVAVGATVVLSATASGTPEPSLQWQRNGAAIAGATGGSLTLSNVGLGDAGTYVLVATNALGTASSSGAVLTVSGAPVITAQPVGQTVLAGTSLTLSVTATGTPVPTYQWRRNGAAIAGATGPSLGLPSIRADGAGTYDVVISNSAGSVTSTPAIIVVDTPSYAGTYFGSFPDGGSWALYVRFDNTATYLAFLPGSSTAIVTNLTINPDGTFTVTGSTIASNPAALSPSLLQASLPGVAAAPLPFTFSGRIVNGQLTGEVLGRAVAGSADTGASQSAGFYSASALLAASGTTFSVVGPSGKALVVTTTPSVVDGGVGSLTESGQVSVSTASGAQLAMTVNSASKSIAATYTASGSTTPLSFAGVQDTVRLTSALANLSIRSNAGTLDQTLIVGFVVAGGSKPVLMRGIGPALAGFGVSGSLPDPKLDLARGGAAVASNDNWTSAAGDLFARVGAFALNAGSRDAALVATLEAAGYTAQLTDVAGAAGVALLELYDTATESGGRLVNVSARSQVGTGGAILIAGFNVSGAGPRRMLIRAIGPGLTAFGVSGALADPKLDLYETGKTIVIATNDNWEQAAAATFGSVGAFGLSAGSRDAVLVVTLTPGSYTAQVSGVGSTTGVALVEVYEVP